MELFFDRRRVIVCEVYCCRVWRWKTVIAFVRLLNSSPITVAFGLLLMCRCRLQHVTKTKRFDWQFAIHSRSKFSLLIILGEVGLQPRKLCNKSHVGCCCTFQFWLYTCARSQHYSVSVCLKLKPRFETWVDFGQSFISATDLTFALASPVFMVRFEIMWNW